MSAPANCALVGRWRMVEADIGDRDHLDLCGPATIPITDHDRGEIAFGALQAGLDIEYSRSSVGFTWEGFDEMDEVSGDVRTLAQRRSSRIVTGNRQPAGWHCAGETERLRVCEPRRGG